LFLFSMADASYSWLSLLQTKLHRLASKLQIITEFTMEISNETRHCSPCYIRKGIWYFLIGSHSVNRSQVTTFESEGPRIQLAAGGHNVRIVTNFEGEGCARCITDNPDIHGPIPKLSI